MPISASGGRPRGQTHRREQILDLASQLFLQHGVEQVTTRQIAAAAGISQPSLYAHFRSRDDIAVELCRRAFAALRQRLASALAGAGSPRQRFEAMAQDYLAFASEQPAAYRVAFMLDMPASQRSAVLAAGLECFSLLRALIAETHGAATDTAAQSAWAALHGLASIMLVRPDFPWAPMAELCRRHVAAVSAGLYGLAAEA